MITKELLARKRDGGTLAAGEIAFLVKGIADGGLTEGQVAAFAMAVCCRGMGRDECVALTDAMTRSGRVLDWRELGKPIVDKHSTGGVGDKTSLMLAPILAAAGAAVPMISGRGLGHTGGTLDKLDAIPGYQTRPSIANMAVDRSRGSETIAHPPSEPRLNGSMPERDKMSDHDKREECDP